MSDDYTKQIKSRTHDAPAADMFDAWLRHKLRGLRRDSTAESLPPDIADLARKLDDKLAHVRQDAGDEDDEDRR